MQSHRGGVIILKEKAAKKPELQNWYKDRYQTVAVQRKLMAFGMLVSLVCTLIMVVIVSQLIPLKTIEPYVLQVDSRTGITQMVDPVTASELTANETVNNYFIVQYIRARESYNAQNLLHNVNIVRLMSDAAVVYGEFISQANPNNPGSSIARFGTLGTRAVKFKSITYLNPQVVQVRVMITEMPDRSTPLELHQIILLRFEYVKMNLTTEERYLNPLGFRVTEYQIDEDVPQL